MERADIIKLASDAKMDINYSLIAYRNPVTDTWTLPSPLQGVGEEAEKSFIINTKRACLLGQVPEQNVGMEAWIIATYADGSGTIKVLEKPRLLVTLTIPSSTEAVAKS